MTHISRRRFLLGASIGAAALLPSTRGMRWLDQALAAGSLESALGRIFQHRTSAVRLGRAYLERRPAESDADVLRFHLRDLAPQAGWMATRPDAVHRRLTSLSREDFGEGRVVLIDGWVLAHTEARACALVALTSG
jgi:hypothetical protein